MQPLYGEAFARYMVQEVMSSTQHYDGLHVVEIGAGNGVLAKNVLDWVQRHHPTLYPSTFYQCVDISPQLHLRQRESLHAHELQGRASCWNLDGSRELPAFPSHLKCKNPLTVVLLMEGELL